MTVLAVHPDHADRAGSRRRVIARRSGGRNWLRWGLRQPQQRLEELLYEGPVRLIYVHHVTVRALAHSSLTLRDAVGILQAYREAVEVRDDVAADPAAWRHHFPDLADGEEAEEAAREMVADAHTCFFHGRT